MPEGPIIVILKEEVEQFKHKRVIAAGGYTEKLDPEKLEGKTVTDFKTFGKNFFICFAGFTVRIHLGLFGSYRINSRGKKNAILSLEFTNGELNFYVAATELIEKPLAEVYDFGADVMNEAWNAKKALEKLKEKPKVFICDALLDQHIFAGVGNIIKNEVLFRTKVHPKSLVDAIPDKKLKEIIKETVKYTFEFLEQKKENTLSKNWQAYEQDECPRNHIAFHKHDLGKTKRKCYYCDKCQKLYG